MNLEEQIMEIVSENTEKAQPLDLTNSLSELGIDSLDVLMVINAIEDEFNITIDDGDFKDIKTIGDILNILRKKYIKIEG